MSARHLLLVAALCAACGSQNEPVKLSPNEAAQPDAGAAMGQMAPVAHEASGALSYATPEGWVTETPSNAMRKAQFRLPKQGSDAHDAQVVVTFLSMDGGGLDANLKRWAGMFRQEDGTDSLKALKHTERSVNGMKVHDVEISGTFLAATDPGAKIEGEQANWRMLMAWVQSAHGNYYVKLLGPAATVAHWEPKFRQFVDSMKESG
jgi:hypothetical protein